MSFSYDARGNLTTGDGLTATYNTWDKPTRLTRSKQGISTTMAFTYGADLMRYKQVRTTDGISSTTYYIDKLYEETHTAGRTEWKAYISDVAVVGETQQQGRYIAFTHKDRLGSGTTFTDHHGQVTALRTFDPFGKPRGNDGARLSNTTLDNLDQSRRGFTDHEHLDEIDIIHMNGRVYDYNLGRFMSVDPVIQSPGNSQSMNPYSYIMNNPLAGADPTGYSAQTKEQKITRSVTVKRPGSRIKKTVEVEITLTDTDNGSGGVTVEISGGGDSPGVASAARRIAKSEITGTLKSSGLKVNDIGERVIRPLPVVLISWIVVLDIVVPMRMQRWILTTTQYLKREVQEEAHFLSS